jgi:hypothetical protein
MRAVLILNKLNFKEGNTKKDTLNLIQHLSSISELEIYLTNGTSSEDYFFVYHNFDKEKVHRITRASIFKIYLKYEFIFTTSYNCNLLIKLAFLPKRAFNIKVSLYKINDNKENSPQKVEYDLFLNLNDLSLNISSLEKIMKAKNKKSNFINIRQTIN